MKIWLLSDLHLDYTADYLPDMEIPEYDVCVMPGDLSNGDYDVMPWLLRLPERVRTQMLYVPGNHDFYKIGIAAGKERLQRIAGETGIVVLDNRRVKLGDQGFIGSTLWSSLAEDAYVENATLDLYHIPDFKGSDYRRLHEEALEYLDSETIPGDIVISHHAPHRDGVDQKFFHNIQLMGLISSQCSALGDLMAALEPKAWVHGHTHIKKSYEVNGIPVHTCADEQLDFTFETDGYTHRPPGYN
jgi:predicted phosphodiesterase